LPVLRLFRGARRITETPKDNCLCPVPHISTQML
jgi:hypothetical protein